MTPIRRLLSQQRGLVLLVCLALLLPIAQCAATWHAHSHDQAAGGERSDKQAPHAGQCDLCLTAAAVTGGAATAQQAGVALTGAGRDAPRGAASASWPAVPALAYQSRAPPQA